MSSRPTIKSSATPALLAASVVVTAAALFLRDARASRLAAEAAATSSTQSESSTRFVADSRAMRLLERTWRADNSLVYSAIFSTTAIYGARRMETKARLMRAPHRLSISYISGDREGLQVGFNERWYWRQDDNTPMQAYVEVAKRPDQMALRRMETLKKNYGARLLQATVLNGKACDVVELRRLKTLDGAVGPTKRLWIERNTGLTIRTDSFNHQGKLVMRSQLSNLQVQRASDASKTTLVKFVQPAQMAEVARTQPWIYEEMNDDYARAHKTVGIATPQVKEVPEGFVFDGVGTHRFDALDKPTATFSRYSDGLNVITVFALKKAADSTQENPSTCDFGTASMAMRQLADGTKLLAVGDLPVQTLQRVLDVTTVPATTSS